MTHLTMAHGRRILHSPGWPMALFGFSVAGALIRALHGDTLLPFVPGHRYGFFDLKIYREAAAATLRGQGLYAAKFQLGFGFTYPPFAILPFLALSVVPLRVVEVASVLINVGLVFVIAQLTLTLANRSGASESPSRRRAGAVWGAAALALWTEPVISAIGYGQIDLVIAALVLADVTLGERRRWGGLGIAAAAALKLTPLIFIPYLALTGRHRMTRRAIGGFVASIAVSFAAMPANAWSYWGDALFHTSRVTGHHPFAGRGPANQSLRGALMRLAPNLPHRFEFWVVGCLLVGATGLWLAVRATRRGDEALGFVLTAVTGLLICPVSWTHHWVIAVPALLMLVLGPRRGFAGRRTAGAAALFAVLSPGICLEVARHQGGAHLGVGGLLLGDLYVLGGLGAIAGAGALEMRRAVPYTGHPGGSVRTIPTSHAVGRGGQSAL